MDREKSQFLKKSGQAILEYVVFAAMFAFAIMFFFHRNFLTRTIQGHMRSAISQSVGVEQFDEATGTSTYDSNVTLFQTPVPEESIDNPHLYPESIIVERGTGAYETAEIQPMSPWH